MIRFVFVLSVIAMAACGNSTTTTHDAMGSGGGATVMMVTCPASPNATITTSNFAFTPASASITVGQVVKFMPESIHNVAPGNVPAGSALSDSGLTCGFGGTCCLMFTHAGTFGFHCAAHTTMNGTITVM